MNLKLLATGMLVLTLAGCGKPLLPVAGAPTAAALEALAKKKKAAPRPKAEDGKPVAGKIATKLTGYWEEGACLLTITPAGGEPVAVLVGPETVVTDAKGKPVATEKLKRGMAVAVTLGAASKLQSQPPTYTATKLVIKKAVPKGKTAEGIELADDYDVDLDG